MAEAKSTTVDKEVVKVEKVKVVTLTLSIEEAAALKAVVGSITGSPFDSPRKYTNSIYHALQRAGVTNGSNSVVNRQLSGMLTFSDTPRRAASPYADLKF